MELLVCVLNKEERLEDLLERFLDIGITGATVIESRGMGKMLGEGVPAFGGLQDIGSLTRDKNVTVFSVVADQATRLEAMRVIKEVCGDLDAPSTGIAFSIPVSEVMGMAGDAAALSTNQNSNNGE